MTLKPSQSMTNILAIHSEWIYIYILSYKAQATRHNLHAKLRKYKAQAKTQAKTQATRR